MSLNNREQEDEGIGTLSVMSENSQINTDTWKYIHKKGKIF